MTESNASRPARGGVMCVVGKELKEIVRDGRMRLLGAIVLVLALAALGFGAHQAREAMHEQEHATERASEQWQGQGDKNPHAAAHYGTHVFAPTSVATSLDPGVSPYLGRVVKLEAHKRGVASHAAAREGGSSTLGSFTVASVLLLLVPLLVVALGYGAWSREREQGTLRQLLATGVHRSTLLAGKALALGAALSVLLAPAGVVILGVLWWVGGGDSAIWGRIGLWAALFGVYFATFAGFTLYASAVGRSSRASLVILVALWGVFCLVVPRLASEATTWARPLPSLAEWQRQVEHALAHGLDGATDREQTVEAIAADMLAAQGITDTGMMVDESFVAGVELQAEAQWEDQIFDHYLEKLDGQMADQERFIRYFGLLSPFVAMQSLSAGLCGTDYAHHQHFSEYAEARRKALVTYLNEVFAAKAGDRGWDYRADASVWRDAPDWAYEPPRAAFALTGLVLPLLALFGWFGVATLLAWSSARRVRVV